MKTKLIAYAGFVAMAAVQLSVPAYMIYQRELTLKTGAPFKFRTAPVDPYDPFRGRYVTLRIEPEEAKPPSGVTLGRNQTIYVSITENEDGFARVEAVSIAPPEQGDFIRAKVRYERWRETKERMVYIRWPFDRYYLEESLAPEAERLYRQHSRGEERDAYVVVRVRSGNAVLEELFIEDTPILEFVKSQLETGA